MWLGVADIDQQKPSENCYFNNPDTSREPDYINWAEEYPKCVPAAHSCGFLDIDSTERNWKTESCGSAEAFACEIDVGSVIHPVPKPPNERHCSGTDRNFSIFIKQITVRGPKSSSSLCRLLLPLRNDLHLRS